MRQYACTCGLAGLLLLSQFGCTTSGQVEARTSVFTSLDTKDCTSKGSTGDPDDTPYRSCPGHGGYSLNVRKAEAGRSTIDVVDPSGRAFPLRLNETVTREMFELDRRAEWRLSGGKPVALTVLVRLHGDVADPAKVTGTVAVVAKVAAAEVCVTDTLPEGGGTIQQVHKAADSARDRTCGPNAP